MAQLGRVECEVSYKPKVTLTIPDVEVEVKGRVIGLAKQLGISLAKLLHLLMETYQQQKGHLISSALPPSVSSAAPTTNIINNQASEELLMNENDKQTSKLPQPVINLLRIDELRQQLPTRERSLEINCHIVKEEPFMDTDGNLAAQEDIDTAAAKCKLIIDHIESRSECSDMRSVHNDITGYGDQESTDPMICDDIKIEPVIDEGCGLHVAATWHSWHSWQRPTTLDYRGPNVEKKVDRKGAREDGMLVIEKCQPDVLGVGGPDVTEDCGPAVVEDCEPDVLGVSGQSVTEDCGPAAEDCEEDISEEGGPDMTEDCAPAVVEECGLDVSEQQCGLGLIAEEGLVVTVECGAGGAEQECGLSELGEGGLDVTEYCGPDVPQQECALVLVGDDIMEKDGVNVAEKDARNAADDLPTRKKKGKIQCLVCKKMLMNVCPHLVTAHQWSKKDAANWRHIKARSNPDPQNKRKKPCLVEGCLWMGVNMKTHFKTVHHATDQQYWEAKKQIRKERKEKQQNTKAVPTDDQR